MSEAQKKFPTSNQLAGRAPPARLGAIPGRLAPAAHRRSPGGDQRGCQPVAQSGQGRWSPSSAPPQASRPPVQVDPPAAAPATGTAGPGATGLWLSWRRLDPAQGGPDYPTPFGVHYHPSQVGRILKQYNWSRQKPLKRASQRDEAAIRRWQEERWPALKKRPGTKAGPSSS
jgi:Winged helix-turn helix